MSTETEARENQVPPEVAALWTQLHAEAIRRRDDLKPATSRRKLAAVGAIAIGVVALVIVGALIARQSDQRSTEATITAAAVAAAKTQAVQQAALETRETQVAATATADWNALQTEQIEAANTTATAAVSATAAAAMVTRAAAVTATHVAGTATAEAIVAATETAVAIEVAVLCSRPASYAADVDSVQTITPAEGTEWITNSRFPFTQASWTVTNTGQCAWEQMVLEPVRGTTQTFLQDNVNAENPIKPGDTVQVQVRFQVPPPSPLDWEFFIKINDEFPLTDLEDRVQLRVSQWIKPVDPTPTPSPTPTATPTPRVGNLAAREPQGQRYMSEGVVFEWTYDTVLENFFRFQILARGPGNVEYPLAIPASCEPYEPQDNNHRCTVRNGGLLPVDGSHTWSVRVIDAADQILRESNTLSFDLSREPQPAPGPDPNPPGTRG